MQNLPITDVSDVFVSQGSENAHLIPSISNLSWTDWTRDLKVWT